MLISSNKIIEHYLENKFFLFFIFNFSRLDLFQKLSPIFSLNSLISKNVMQLIEQNLKLIQLYINYSLKIPLYIINSDILIVYYKKLLTFFVFFLISCNKTLLYLFKLFLLYSIYYLDIKFFINKKFYKKFRIHSILNG